MKKIYRLLFVLAVLPAIALANQLPDHQHGQDEKQIAPTPPPNASIQASLRKTTSWQQFEHNYGNWNVVFDEANGMPYRAFGSPIPVPIKTDDVTRARYFLSHALSSYPIPVENLELLSNVSTAKYTYIKFYQEYKGLKILNSKAQVRFNVNGDVAYFQLSVYPNATATTTPAFGKGAIAGHLEKFFSQPVKSIETADKLALLATTTGNEENNLRLVYQLKVYTDAMEGVYKVFLDAETGEVLYSQNLVHNANSSLDLTATVHKVNPFVPATELPVQNVMVEIDGTTYYTDENGHLDIDLSAPTQAKISLSGKWSTVYQGNSSKVISSFTTTLQPGNNTISFDNDASLRELSAYYHVNQIHDFMKKSIPTFDKLDNSLDTRVDRTDGSCNAFYNGNSINFYAPGNGCQAFSLLGDVVYHEYGHGINAEFYDWLGETFDNGALGEGYADVWALALTKNPVLGLGRSLSNPNSYIRRYDINPKIYPQNLVGEVHADGEIIAGAWWDLGQNLDSVELMFDIFLEAYYATPTAFSGDEGRLYYDILIDALMADDDDGDITNGSPNDSDIIDAFAKHGITLLSGAELDHDEILVAQADDDIAIEADLVTTFNSYVKDLVVYYQIEGTLGWKNAPMLKENGTLYTASIPSQPKGTIINYYLRLKDTYNNIVQLQPAEANFSNPNIPYQILVGYNRFHIEDFDEHQGNWTVGLPTDDAAAGQWEIGKPSASYVSLSNPSSSSLVQTGSDHTLGYGNCAVTGNSSSISTASLYDVDRGVTTLISPVFDLGSYDDPAISYYRWFTNRQGSNPGNDSFEVAISDDGGASWKNVEYTNVPDKSWRRHAFKVKDYVNDLRTIQIRFIASDKMVSGQSNGQSLVEAAIDDLEIWDTKENTGIVDAMVRDLSMKVFPNPASGNVRIIFNPEIANGTIRLLSASGQVVTQNQVTAGTGFQEMDIANLPSGLYLVELADGKYYQRVKLSVVR